LQQLWQVMSEGGFITDEVAVIDTSRLPAAPSWSTPAELGRGVVEGSKAAA